MSINDLAELTLIEARVANRAPRGSVAYICWFLGGLFGIHRFYLGRWGTGLLMICTLGGVGIWTILDLLLIPGMVRVAQERTRAEETQRVISNRPAPSPIPKERPTIDAELVDRLLNGGD